MVQSHLGSAVILFPPRGVGPTRWTETSKVGNHIQRRFMLLGQTADGMRIFDIRRCLQAIGEVPQYQKLPIAASGRGVAAAWLLFASLQSPSLTEVRLEDLPTTNREAISLLNVSRVIEIPQAVLMATTRVESVELVNAEPNAARWRAIAGSSRLFADRVRVSSGR